MRSRGAYERDSHYSAPRTTTSISGRPANSRVRAPTRRVLHCLVGEREGLTPRKFALSSGRTSCGRQCRARSVTLRLIRCFCRDPSEYICRLRVPADADARPLVLATPGHRSFPMASTAPRSRGRVSASPRSFELWTGYPSSQVALGLPYGIQVQGPGASHLSRSWAPALPGAGSTCSCMPPKGLAAWTPIDSTPLISRSLS